MKKSNHITVVILLLFFTQISFAEDLLSWTEIGILPANVSGRHMIAAGDYWYAMEGDEGNQGHLGTLYSQFQTGGSIGTWASTSSRTIDRYGYGITSSNGYIYLIGGKTDSNNCTNIVEYAGINPDGSLTAWTQTSSMSQARMAPAVVIHGKYIYAIGGHDDLGNPHNTIIFSEIQPDGSLGNWNAMGSNLQMARSHSTAIVRNGFIYVFGGDNNGSATSTIERAEVYFPSGNLGGWVYENMLVEPRASAGIAVIDEWVYMIGGNAGLSSAQAHSSVEYSAFHPVDGSLQAWQYSPSSLNHEAWYCHTDVWNGFIYATANGVIEMTTQVSNAGTLQLLSPNGGEELIAGQTETINWSSTGSITNILLEYSSNNGVDWTSIEANTPNDGEYEWVAPQVTSEDCLVRISNASVPSINDSSDTVFTIFVCQLDSVADLDSNCKVDLYDFALMAVDWLRNGNPFDAGFTEYSGE